jgi:hypothetical protein
MPKNVHAYTARGASYPEYISVNETDDPNLFTITVRSKAKADGSEGDSAVITLTMPQIDQLAGDIMRAVTGTAV